MSGLPPRVAAEGTAAASRARRARAELKAQMAFSGESLRWALARCDEPDGAPIRRMLVTDLLAAMPGIGPARAAQMAELVGIAPGRRLGGLGPRQAEALAALIDRRAAQRAGRAR